MREDRTTKRDTDIHADRDSAEPTGSDPDSALRRWSRRKHETAGRDPAPATSPDRTASRTAEQQGEDPPEAVPDPPLPPVDSIDESSDVSGFLRPGVDQALQRAALRRLFHCAKFNVTDGLDVYAGNYRNFEPLGEIVTADMRYHVERLTRAAGKLADEKNRGAGQAPVDAAPAHGEHVAGEPAGGREGDEDGGDDGEADRA